MVLGGALGLSVVGREDDELAVSVRELLRERYEVADLAVDRRSEGVFVLPGPPRRARCPRLQDALRFG